MGYFKDNFPGSAAQLQRRKVCAGFVGYAFVVGSAIILFSPFAKLHREELKKGTWDNPTWHKERSALLQGGFLKSNTAIAKKKVEEIFEDSDPEKREDFTGPSLYRETAKYKKSSPTVSNTESIPK